jgi:hypothetical protein
MVVHSYNPSTQEAEAGGLQVPGQSGLHREAVSKKKKFPKFRNLRRGKSMNSHAKSTILPSVVILPVFQE